MTLPLVSLLFASLFEFILGTPLPATLRHSLAAGISFVLAYAAVALLISHLAMWTILLAILSLYRILNLLRLIKDQRNINSLQRLSRQSWLWLCGAQLLTITVVFISNRIGFPLPDWWSVLIIIQFGAVLVLFRATWRNLKTTKHTFVPGNYADRDLPTISVLVPARNETDDLADCLESLIGSTYPKLEILVLDDCSVIKRTPEIIRGYAHAGVRFIAGKEPPANWLAKNYAYQQLADEANGEYLLFCGVDTRFNPDSIRLLVEAALLRKKAMLSILPHNILPHRFRETLATIQIARYVWELSLPRRLFSRPPVLSTCWLIGRTEFQAAGECRAVARSVTPERYFARYCATHRDAYSFIQSDELLAVRSVKKLDEQRQTAQRTRYPQLHQKLEFVAFVSSAELLILLAPFVLFIATVLRGDWLAAVLSLISVLLLVTIYSLVARVTYRKFLWQSLLIEPWAVLTDVALLNYSLWQYEFGEILWKGRNICIPVMQAIPRLPVLPEDSSE